MREALKALPCVEPSSVKINFPKKEAHFAAKKDAHCEIEEVKKTITDRGYTVFSVRSPATAP